MTVHRPPRQKSWQPSTTRRIRQLEAQPAGHHHPTPATGLAPGRCPSRRDAECYVARQRIPVQNRMICTQQPARAGATTAVPIRRSGTRSRRSPLTLGSRRGPRSGTRFPPDLELAVNRRVNRTREIDRRVRCARCCRQSLALVVPGGPARIVGTYSSSWRRPSKVRLVIMSSATSG